MIISYVKSYECNRIKINNLYGEGKQNEEYKPQAILRIVIVSPLKYISAFNSGILRENKTQIIIFVA